MDIRQLQYLVALAREKHFTRAAQACNVTQPTLSGAISRLEQDLGVAIVARGKRYHGLTPEGEIVLRWAQRLLEDRDRLLGDLAEARDAGAGRLTLGVIPSALPAVPPLAAAMRAGGRNLGFTVLSRSSEEIRRELEEFTLDAGITYLGNEPIGATVARPLYRETYRLLVRADHPLAEREAVSWAEAAHQRLCALTPNMQNRRIVDAAFRAAGEWPVPEVESNSVVDLCAFVRLNGLACVLPEVLITVVADRIAYRGIPLVEPDMSYEIGLIALDRDPLPALVAEALAAAETYRMPADLGGGPAAVD